MMFKITGQVGTDYYSNDFYYVICDKLSKVVWIVLIMVVIGIQELFAILFLLLIVVSGNIIFSFYIVS